MKNNELNIIKSSGKKVRFSLEKLRNSLGRSGADTKTIDQIVNIVRDELYQGISTKEIYNRAFALLKKEKSFLASRYKLKKAIYELGPTGFPFEKFVAEILRYSGYKVEIGRTIQGKYVSHEVDVIARKKNEHLIVECKFHSEEGRNYNVKIPLYLHSRYRDIAAYYKDQNNKHTPPNQGWVVTNTRFTKDAIQYGKCSGLHVLSWDYPIGNGLKDRIDMLQLYPITVATLLTNHEKQFLLSRDVVLCKQLIGDAFYLDHLGISEQRKQKILKEVKKLCYKTQDSYAIN